MSEPEDPSFAADRIAGDAAACRAAVAARWRVALAAALALGDAGPGLRTGVFGG